MNSRNLRRKIWFWLRVLRRKNQICWSEKSKFGFWEGRKCDFDLTFRILGVKNWKNQISWSEKSKSEKRKPDFDLAPGVKSWIWVLRRKEQDFWSEKSKISAFFLPPFIVIIVDFSTFLGLIFFDLLVIEIKVFFTSLRLVFLFAVLRFVFFFPTSLRLVVSHISMNLRRSQKKIWLGKLDFKAHCSNSNFGW